MNRPGDAGTRSSADDGDENARCEYCGDTELAVGARAGWVKMVRLRIGVCERRNRSFPIHKWVVACDRCWRRMRAPDGGGALPAAARAPPPADA